jgi:predicted membrane-bound mannosyltransferase
MHNDTPMAIVAPPSDIWPLPWYLRKYTAVGYWNDIADLPEGFTPAILIVSLDQTLAAHERFGNGKQVNLFGIRPSIFLNVLTPVPEE